MTTARRFEGRTVLVTGASRGLGRAIAEAFAAEGAWVAIGYHRRAREAEAALAAVQARGGDGIPLSFDVADRAAVDAAITQLLAARGAIDVVVNNAALGADEPFAMMEAKSWREVLGVNLDGAFHVCRAVVRPMLARRRGAIVNVASVAGLRASPGQANYAASKGGLLAFTRTIAAELAPRGIRVNAVVPGFLATGMAARMDPRRLDRARAAIPLGRAGTAEEVARAVLFLAADESSYVVGQALVVDGGLAT